MNPDPEDARRYLDEALKAEGVTLLAASREVGMNDAYFHQYIKMRKPLYLKEEVRAALVRKWPSIDPERLRPPPKKPKSHNLAGRKRKDQGQVHPQGYGKFIDDPSTLDLLAAWQDITKPHLRALLLETARALAAASRADAA